MSNEWFEVAYINHSEAILHGQIVRDDSQVELRQVLTEGQRQAIVDLNERHRDEEAALLRSFVA